MAIMWTFRPPFHDLRSGDGQARAGGCLYGVAVVVAQGECERPPRLHGAAAAGQDRSGGRPPCRPPDHVRGGAAPDADVEGVVGVAHLYPLAVRH